MAGPVQEEPTSPLPRIGGMATMPTRIDSLRTALPHILPQVDRLYLFFDKYEEVPREFATDPKIVTLLPKDRNKSLGCAGKFYGLRLNPEPCLYFCFDDDIIYPGKYVAHIAAALRRHHYRAVVGVHGAVYKVPIKSYVRDRVILHFRSRLDFDVLVDEIGTGTLAFHSGCIRLDPARWRHPNMTDLCVMIECIRQKVPRICVRRPAGFLQAIEEGQADSLHRESLLDDRVQTGIVQACMKDFPDGWCMSS